MAYRVRATGEYPVSKSDLIAAFPNVSFPAAWDQSVLDFLGVDEVFLTPHPATDRLTFIREAAPTLTPNETWEQAWEVVDIRTGMTEEHLAELLTTLRAETKANVAERRWQAEVGGADFNGLRLATDRTSQAMVAGASMLAEVRPELLIDWKTQDGWVQISNGQIASLSLVVGLHVQACFRRERELNDEVDAAQTIADILAIDITTGWPS